MPELPEVETMCRGIRHIVGAKIVNVERAVCRKRKIEISPRIDRIHRALAGTVVVDVTRLGKKVVLVNDDGYRLVFEPRMTGLVLVGPPPTLEHLRLQVQLKSPHVDRVLFWDRRGLGKVFGYSATEYDQLLASGQLGPDALAISAAALRERMGESSQPIKVALLDQKKVAGIGNLYASEILHLAGVSPLRACRQVRARQWQAIHQWMVRVLQLAIEYEGSTLSDGTYRNALNDPGSYQNEHRVYDKAGQECPTCHKSKIIRIVQAQRSTFYCKRCQR